MAEFTINIAPEKEHLIKLLVEELGGEVIGDKKKKAAPKKRANKTTSVKPKKSKEVSPTFLFGKWKDVDIDAKKLREQAWGRNHKFS